MQLRTVLFAILVVTFFACKEKREEMKIEVAGELKNIDSL